MSEKRETKMNQGLSLSNLLSLYRANHPMLHAPA